MKNRYSWSNLITGRDTSLSMLYGINPEKTLRDWGNERYLSAGSYHDHDRPPYYEAMDR